MKELIGKTVKITKLESVRYKDGHPNGIEEGFTHIGTLRNVEIGGVLEMTGPRGIWDYFYTSRIDKIEGDLVYTKNSVYKVEEYVPVPNVNPEGL